MPDNWWIPVSRESRGRSAHTHKIVHIYNRHSTCRVCTIDFVNIIYVLCVYMYIQYTHVQVKTARPTTALVDSTQAVEN